MLAAACLQLITRLLVSKTNKVMKLSVFISSRSQFLISYVRIYLLLTSSQLRYFLCRISINHKSHPMSQLHYYNCSHVQTSKDRWRPICLPSHLSSSNDFGGCRLSARWFRDSRSRKRPSDVSSFGKRLLSLGIMTTAILPLNGEHLLNHSEQWELLIRGKVSRLDTDA